jgi:acyl transferase domain-containing protein
MGAKDPQDEGLFRVSGTESMGLSNKISYEYDLKGPSMTIRTACSSSLVALHEACQSLYNGNCSSAIVAGTNLILTPTMTIAMTEQGVLSPDGISKSFDAAANGYARGEGINAVLIKPLSDAIRDGDNVRAVIRATASNCDGRALGGMSMPNPEAHEAMIRRAYKVAGIEDFSETAMVECHATGTSVVSYKNQCYRYLS